MKQFKILIDCPWGKKGEMAPENLSTYFAFRGDIGRIVNPSDYPELFQEVMSDQEILAEYLFKVSDDYDPRVSASLSANLCEYMAKQLLSQGAINKEWLENCRERGSIFRGEG